MENVENKVQIVELGFYHPSNTNWSYHIFMLIDSTGARLYRSQFGGDSRIAEKLSAQGLTVERYSPGVGSNVEYKWRNIKDLNDIEEYPGKNWGEGALK